MPPDVTVVTIVPPGGVVARRPLRRPNRCRPLARGAAGPRPFDVAQERAALRAGWDDPGLDDYNDGR